MFRKSSNIVIEGSLSSIFFDLRSISDTNKWYFKYENLLKEFDNRLSNLKFQEIIK